MMVLYINGRFFAEPFTGIQRYALEVLRCIDRLVEKNQSVILLMPPYVPCPESFSRIKVRSCGYLTGNLWEQIELPFFSRNGFLLNLCNRAPLFKWRQTIVVYDAAICVTPDRFSWKFRVFLRILYFFLGQNLRSLVTISEFSNAEICKWFHIVQEKVFVAYAGSEHIQRIHQDKQILSKHGLVRGQYIISVGGTENKNIPMIVRALPYLQDLDITFVITGKLNANFVRSLQDLDAVKVMGYVSDEALLALYANAAGLVFPSLYEGFGIPPLEAMSVGCPVIVSDRASLPEICGDAALYCDPLDEKDIAARIREIVSDGLLSESLRSKGYEQVKKFSWIIAARKILKQCGLDYTV